MIASFMILVFVFQRFRFAFAFSVTHILTHNRKNGGGDNGHKTAGWNENPSGKRCKASESPGRAYRLPLITRGIFAEARPADDKATAGMAQRSKSRGAPSRTAILGTARGQGGNAAAMLYVLLPQPCCATKKDIAPENPDTTTVSGFFRTPIAGCKQKDIFLCPEDLNYRPPLFQAAFERCILPKAAFFRFH